MNNQELLNHCIELCVTSLPGNYYTRHSVVLLLQIVHPTGWIQEFRDNLEHKKTKTKEFNLKEKKKKK